MKDKNALKYAGAALTGFATLTSTAVSAFSAAAIVTGGDPTKFLEPCIVSGIAAFVFGKFTCDYVRD